MQVGATDGWSPNRPLLSDGLLFRKEIYDGEIFVFTNIW